MYSLPSFCLSALAQLEQYRPVIETYPGEDTAYTKRIQKIDATCKYKRRTVYEDLKGLPTEALKVPVVDQDGTGDCYSFATTQAIEIHNRLNGAKKGCEQLHWAWGSAKSKRFSSIPDKIFDALETKINGGGGYPANVYKVALEHGFCPHQDVSRAFARYRKDLGMSDAEIMAFFYKLHHFNDQEGYNFRRSVTAAYKRTISDRGVNFSEISCPDQVFKIAEELRYVNFGPAILKSAWGKLEDDMERACGERGKCGIVPMKNTRSKVTQVSLNYTKTFNDKDKLDNLILENLCGSEIPRPMVLGYCSQMFETGEGRMVYDKNGDLVRESFQGCGGHAAVIAGYREHPKTALKQILIRNSYGASFKPSSDDCECRSDKGTSVSCSSIKGAPSLKNETVGCWYPLSQVMESAMGIDYVK